MIDEILTPVSKELQNFAIESKDIHCLGKKIQFDYSKTNSKSKIVIFGLNINSKDKNLFENIRKQLYQLKFGDWFCEIYDLGDIHPGFEESDTQFAFNEICKFFIKENAIVVVLSNETKVMQWQHLAFGKRKAVNLTTVDSKIAIGNINEPLNAENYLGKLIESQTNITHYSNIGYQSYFVAKEELELMDQLGYDYFRLGEIIENIKYITPSLLNTHSVTVNLGSLQNFYDKDNQKSNPNGINSREICTLAYYSGIGNSTQLFGLHNYQKIDSKLMIEELISQTIWYFIEGINNRQAQKSFDSADYFEKYSLPHLEKELFFYRNILNDNWWVSVGKQKVYYPCGYVDYQEAVQNHFTMRIKNILKK